jgi:hypothetical protein
MSKQGHCPNDSVITDLFVSGVKGVLQKKNTPQNELAVQMASETL